MTKFYKDSAFARADQQKLIEVPPTEQMVIGKAEVKLPLDHWHHDLVTIDIMLDSDPPDVDRARRMIQEIAQELTSHMKG